jgi:hypothetical protein
LWRGCWSWCRVFRRCRSWCNHSIEHLHHTISSNHISCNHCGIVIDLYRSRFTASDQNLLPVKRLNLL